MVYQLSTHLLLFVLLRHKRHPLEITAKLWCLLAQDLSTGAFQLICSRQMNSKNKKILGPFMELEENHQYRGRNLLVVKQKACSANSVRCLSNKILQVVQ